MSDFKSHTDLAIERAVKCCAEMHRGAWKGRVDPDELEALIRCLQGRGTDADRGRLLQYGVDLT